MQVFQSKAAKRPQKSRMVVFMYSDGNSIYSKHSSLANNARLCSVWRQVCRKFLTHVSRIRSGNPQNHQVSHSDQTALPIVWFGIIIECHFWAKVHGEREGLACQANRCRMSATDSPSMLRLQISALRMALCRPYMYDVHLMGLQQRIGFCSSACESCCNSDGGGAREHRCLKRKGLSGDECEGERVLSLCLAPTGPCKVSKPASLVMLHSQLIYGQTRS